MKDANKVAEKNINKDSLMIIEDISNIIQYKIRISDKIKNKDEPDIILSDRLLPTKKIN